MLPMIGQDADSDSEQDVLTIEEDTALIVIVKERLESPQPVRISLSDL